MYIIRMTVECDEEFLGGGDIMLPVYCTILGTEFSNQRLIHVTCSKVIIILSLGHTELRRRAMGDIVDF